MTASTPPSAFEAKLGTDVLTNEEMIYPCLDGMRSVSRPAVTPNANLQKDKAALPPSPLAVAAHGPGFGSADATTNGAQAAFRTVNTAATAGGAPRAEQLTASATGDNESVLQEIQRAAASAVSGAAANSSKAELASVLEGFARVLRDDARYASISYADHAAEIEQLKALLMKAQETIINLLNDRVFDRAKLARLETESRFFPDVQAQAHRAMNLVSQSEDVKKELAQVRAEVERLSAAHLRSQQKPASWLSRMFKQSN